MNSRKETYIAPSGPPDVIDVDVDVSNEHQPRLKTTGAFRCTVRANY